MDKTPLTEAEWKIMQFLWQSSPQTMTELTRIFSAVYAILSA